MQFVTINPSTGENTGTFQSVSAEESLRYAKDARRAFERWGGLGIEERADYLKELSSSLRARKEEFARTITQEMGKPIRQSLGEIEKCAWLADVYAENGAEWLRDDVFETDAKRSSVVYEPLGVVLSIMPWNFPFWQALRFAVPALLAGNTTLIRHSRIVPRCARALEESFIGANFPEGVFRAAITDHGAVERLISSDSVAAVSFTGSVESGSRIGELAGRHIKKAVLELGGSDPFIVMDDSSVGDAAEKAAEARLMNSGQSCVAAKRFLVMDSVAEEFTEAFVRNLERAKVGDPMKRETDVGPLAAEEHLSNLEGQVQDAVRKGGKILTGGRRIGGLGYFYEPTAIGESRAEMRVMKEEVFGPAAPVFFASDEEQIVKIANETEFGLAASVWTRDMERAYRISRRLDVGVIFINAIVKSDPRMPFGGIKRSGFGRELSKHGIQEFVNVKGINVY